jgi:hypothetical protein
METATETTTRTVSEQAVDYEALRAQAEERVRTLRPSWSILRTRNERSLGLDSELAADYEAANSRMDSALEELYGHCVMLGRIGITPQNEAAI